MAVATHSRSAELEYECLVGQGVYAVSVGCCLLQKATCNHPVEAVLRKYSFSHAYKPFKMGGPSNAGSKTVKTRIIGQ